jgi:hypothetical protein
MLYPSELQPLTSILHRIRTLFARGLGDRIVGMLHRTAEERFEKLKSVHHRLLDENFHKDDFVQGTNILPGWICRDPIASAA